MKIHVGKQQVAQTFSSNKQILKEGKWIQEKISNDTQYQGLGKFDPIEISKDALADLLICFNEEKLSYPYKVEKLGDKYYIV